MWYTSKNQTSALDMHSERAIPLSRSREIDKAFHKPDKILLHARYVDAEVVVRTCLSETGKCFL